VAEPIYKFVLFLKRKPGMTPEEFEHYYENVHSKLGKQIVPDVGAFKYVRRYLTPIAGSLGERAEDLEYDEITEVWFRDYEKFKAVAERVSRGELAPEVAEDEAKFMDRSKTRFATVVEYEHSFE
jgi:EthD domain